MSDPAHEPPTDFIRQRIRADVAAGKHGGRVCTRFPPEPNGYLHIGHAKAICVNFGIAEEFGGTCNLRFDDTNPAAEETRYVESIEEDVRWLGFDWGDRRYFASDYFETLYEYAVSLVRAGKAYVDSQPAEAIREQRGTLTAPGTPSPFRDRSAGESLDLLARMRAGEFPDGSHVLRARIDMAHPNMNMRDPVLYRIRHAAHHRTGTDWVIYPTYDFAHGQSDSIEGITHSLCTLEFEHHRPLYDWLCENIGIHHPQQIEFARLNLSYTVMSKRKLLRLVQEGVVSGWDDPRLPTLAGLRRRGVPPSAIRAFCERIGLAKYPAVHELSLLEHVLREDLNATAPRLMAVLDPIKVTITTWPAGAVDELDAVNNPEDPSAGTRKVPFSGELWIERDDFMKDPPKKYFRLAPGREVRLRYGYFIRCDEVVEDAGGRVVELRCSHDPATRGGDAPDGRKVKATLHWVSAAHALPVEVRLYDRLFATELPDEAPPGQDFMANLNPSSLEVRTGCWIEPAAAGMQPLDRCQLERIGYFCADADSTPQHLVFNRTVGLRDTWAKVRARG